MHIPVTFSLAALILVGFLVFPQISEDACTDAKKFDFNRWFIHIFHCVSQRQFAYQIASLLWKGKLLEESMGSIRFASMMITLLLTREVIVLVAAQGWQFWRLANKYSTICPGHLWRIFFGMYGFLIPAYPCWNPLVIPTIFAAELTFVHVLFPTIPLSVPFCNALVGFLWSYAPQYLVRLRKGDKMIEINESSDTRVLVWTCHSCKDVNGVFLNVCERCETPHQSFTSDIPDMGNSQRSLINRIPSQKSLVWICRSCTFENGVFVDPCERCRTPRPTPE